MQPYGWTLADVLAATGGDLLAETTVTRFSGVQIDSRQIDSGQLFVAVAGDTHDGHDFIADVIEKGGRGIVVAAAKTAHLPMERAAAAGVAAVAVPDTTRALGALARFNRRRHALTVAAITGSNGKTSTRMLTERVLARQFTTLATHGNLNNHIGLPLTLLRLAPEHRCAVLELGMNHPGEITTLGRICEPDIGIITNVNAAHLEGLGTVDGVAAAKGELLRTLRPGGTAVLNADDPRVAAMADGVDGRVLFFGTGGQAVVRAEAIRLTEAGQTFTLVTPSGDIPVSLATPSRVMVLNALAAAAVGEVMGVSLASVKMGLAAFCPRPGRMGIRHPGGDIQLIDDTYNANPASMAAAIETLARMRGGRRTLAVLGDMLELGPQSADLHRNVGGIVGQARIDRLYATGRFADALADGAIERGMTTDCIFTGDKDALVAQLNRDLCAGDLVLVKGSRGMAMETVVDAISRWAERQ